MKRRVMLAVVFAVTFAGAADLPGTLTLRLPGTPIHAGDTINVELQVLRKTAHGAAALVPGAVDDRDACFELLPYRFELFGDTPIPVTAERISPTVHRVTIPDGLRSDWYLLSASVADADGALHAVADALLNDKLSGLVTQRVIPIRGSGTHHIRVHTERARCVFALGEEVRVYLSGRSAIGMQEMVNVVLQPVDGMGATPLSVGSVVLDTKPGEERTVAFDLPTAWTAALVPGQYNLTAYTAQGQQLDTLEIGFVSPHRQSAAALLALAMPGGTSRRKAYASMAHPAALMSAAYAGVVDDIAIRIHHANLWWDPIDEGAGIAKEWLCLPEAMAPDMPPAAAARRPPLRHAFYQLLMARGIALGLGAACGPEDRQDACNLTPTAVSAGLETIPAGSPGVARAMLEYPSFIALDASPSIATHVDDIPAWETEGVPPPYFLPTFLEEALQNGGRPVYECGIWKQMGMPSHFMRDAIFWAGRQIHVGFNQPRNMSWAHKGADQSTYAANDRLQAVTELMMDYGGLVNALEPIREVGLYVPAFEDLQGKDMLQGYGVAILATLMTDHQVHVVLQDGLPKGALAKYRICFVPDINRELRPFEIDAFRQFVDGGGIIVGTPRQKDGQETGASRAALDQAPVWGAVSGGVLMAPIDVRKRYTHRDARGNPVVRHGPPGSGHQTWAPYRGRALDQYSKLKKVFDGVAMPLVSTDQPEVFVGACHPHKGGTKGLFLFVSNWTLPDEPDLFTYRAPQGFFSSSVKPLSCELRVRAPLGGAVYDVLTATRIETRTKGDRLCFTAGLSAVEGRIYAVYPRPVESAVLEAPLAVEIGAKVSPCFKLQDGAGEPLGVLGSVHITWTDAAGHTLQELYRALGANGRLPDFNVPINARGALQLSVTDTITGQSAKTTVALIEEPQQAVTGPRKPRPLPLASPADAVTCYRPSRIASFLRDCGRLRLVTDAGRTTFGRNGVLQVSKANPHEGEARLWAETLRATLQRQGVVASVESSRHVVTRPPATDPQEDSGATGSQREQFPGGRIDGPIMLVGSPLHSPLLQGFESTRLAGRSLGPENVGPGRAAILWLPRAFSRQADTVLVAATDAAGIAAATRSLTALFEGTSQTDSFYAAREATRRAWTPGELARIDPVKEPPVMHADTVPAGTMHKTSATATWPGLMPRFGTPIFAIDASAGGVAVGTKSWARPTGLYTPAGTPVGFWGGGREVCPRDVAVSADGTAVIAGYSLLGVAAAYGRDGRLWQMNTPLCYTETPFAWDSFKDSDRHMGISPDHTLVVVPDSNGFIVARDARSGHERWRIASDTAPDCPRGQPQAELAFSRDGTFVLLTVQTCTPALRVSYDVHRRGNPPALPAGKKANREGTPLEADLYRTDLVLVNALSGESLWRRAKAVQLFDRETGHAFWTCGMTPCARKQASLGQRRTWQGKAAMAAPINLANGQSLEPSNLLELPLPHLYSTVGPGGQWTILGTGSARLAILDRMGRTVRVLEARDLPEGLQGANGTPVRFSYDTRGEKLLAYTPGQSSLFLIDPFSSGADGVGYHSDDARSADRRGAYALRIEGEIDAGAIINAATADWNLETVYAACWDGTVRAYETRTGTQTWQTHVMGGCQLAGVHDGRDGRVATLYAGGSRGELYRIDPRDGSIVWHRNVTRLTERPAGLSLP